LTTTESSPEYNLWGRNRLVPRVIRRHSYSFQVRGFLFACTASFPLSILGTIVFGIRTPQSTDISLFDLFVGGGIGAFVVLLSGMLLFGPPKMRGETLGLAFLSSFGGSILGLLGGALNLALGQHPSGDFGSSVFIV
jgi:hypothetical protein